MNDYSDLLDDLVECECPWCKNVWWVPGYGIEVVWVPEYCPFCGIGLEEIIA